MSKHISPIVLDPSLTNGANEPLYLDSMGKLPAVDGSNLTGVSGGGGGVGSVSNILAYDSFSTYPDESNLLGQSTEIGSLPYKKWFAVQDDFAVVGGYAYCLNSSANSALGVDVAATSYCIEAIANATSSVAIGVFFRSTLEVAFSTGSSWHLSVGSAGPQLLKYVGGTATVVDTFSFAAPTNRYSIVRVFVTPIEFTIQVNDFFKRYVNADLASSTGAGIQIYQDLNTGFDSFTIYDSTAKPYQLGSNITLSTQPNIIINDDFTGTNGTSLVGRVAPTGGTWTAALTGTNTSGQLTIQDNGTKNLNSSGYGDVFINVGVEEYDVEVRFGTVGSLTLAESIFLYVKSNAAGTTPYQYVAFYSASATTAGLSCYSGGSSFSSQSPSTLTFLSTDNVVLAKVRIGHVVFYFNGVFFGAVTTPINKDFIDLNYFGIYMPASSNSVIESVKVTSPKA